MLYFVDVQPTYYDFECICDICRVLGATVKKKPKWSLRLIQFVLLVLQIFYGYIIKVVCIWITNIFMFCRCNGYSKECEFIIMKRECLTQNETHTKIWLHLHKSVYFFKNYLSQSSTLEFLVLCILAVILTRSWNDHFFHQFYI